jgi:Uma2 family endonuclease
MVATRLRMTADEYLAWERDQPEKHEFFKGEVFAMAGASPRHNALCVNVAAILSAALRPRGCTTLSSDQRVGYEAHARYSYPDISVVCGRLEVEHNDVLNPQVLVEVLSGSTESYDRGSKWDGYQRIESLQDYVLVSQGHARIEHFQRAADGTWTYRSAAAGGSITLSNGAILVVDELFAGVFELPGDPPPEQPDPEQRRR